MHTFFVYFGAASFSVLSVALVIRMFLLFVEVAGLKRLTDKHDRLLSDLQKSINKAPGI